MVADEAALEEAVVGSVAVVVAVVDSAVDAAAAEEASEEAVDAADSGTEEASNRVVAGDAVGVVEDAGAVVVSARAEGHVLRFPRSDTRAFTS